MLKTKNTIRALLNHNCRHNQGYATTNQGYATTNQKNSVEANIYGAIMAAIENNYTPTPTQTLELEKSSLINKNFRGHIQLNRHIRKI